tara:strand:- start:2713 stop:3243 length:531 start_codon:yes stop_codon:yes gene_type:complete
LDSEQFITDDYWQLIKYNYDQIRFAELKASVIISIYSIFFTVAYTIDILDEENVYSFDYNDPFIYFKISVVCLAIFFTIRSFVYSINCFLPKLKLSTKPSPLFFGDIKPNWPKFEDYSKELIRVMDDDDEYKVHLSQMAYVTGIISSSKFAYVTKGIKNLTISICFYLLFFILVYT